MAKVNRKISKKVKQSRKKLKRQAGGISQLVKQIIYLPRSIYRFLKSVGHELKLVEWLSRKQTAKWSSAVIITALALGAFLVLSDTIFFKFRDLLFKL